MHEKDGAKAKWTKFSEDKGFIAILMLCIAAIGISGYVLFFLPAEQAAEEYEIGLGESLPSANAAVPDSMPKVPDVTMQLEPEPAPEPVPVQKETAVDGPTEVILPAEEEELAEGNVFDLALRVPGIPAGLFAGDDGETDILAPPVFRHHHMGAEPGMAVRLLAPAVIGAKIPESGAVLIGNNIVGLIAALTEAPGINALGFCVDVLLQQGGHLSDAIHGKIHIG